VLRTTAVHAIGCSAETRAGVHVTVTAVERGVETFVTPWLGS
jgi:hypothetical protein